MSIIDDEKRTRVYSFGYIKTRKKIEGGVSPFDTYPGPDFKILTPYPLEIIMRIKQGRGYEEKEPRHRI